MKTIVQLVEKLKEYLLEKDTAAKQAVEANIAPVEADPSSASRAYVVGDQLILNDVLYDVTSPISVEDAIVVGTNITAANKLSVDIKSLTNNTYNVNDIAITEVASDDLLPIYDTSASGKKKIAVSCFIGGLVSNPNLLDNPWFTVNQREQSSYSGVGYTVDRWIIANTKTVINVNSDNSVSLGGVEDNSNSFIQEKFDVTFFNELKGKTVTFSIMLDDGTVLSKTGTFPSSYSTESSLCSMYDTVLSLSAVYIKTSGQVWVQVGHIYNGTSRTIKAVKLEIGSVSTLAQDTAPNYATELLKCQRYFYRLKSPGNNDWIAIGKAWSSSQVNVIIGIPTMRALPIASVSDMTKLLVAKGSSTLDPHRVSAILAGYYKEFGNSIVITLTLSDSTVTNGDSYVLKSESAVNIDFSADI